MVPDGGVVGVGVGEGGCGDEVRRSEGEDERDGRCLLGGTAASAGRSQRRIVGRRRRRRQPRRRRDGLLAEHRPRVLE